MTADSIERIIEAFERDGFVNGGSVLERQELEQLRSEVERFADTQIRGRPPIGPMPQFEELGHDSATRHYKMIDAWSHSDAFRRLVRQERLLALAAALMKTRTLSIWADTIQYKPALEGGPVNWHQDGYYHLGFGGIKQPDRVLSAWIALDDADEDSGCMWMVPGSHRWGMREGHLQHFKHLRERSDIANVPPWKGLSSEQWREPRSCPVKAGEVHFHHAFTWHASPCNTSMRTRRGYTIFYLADGVDLSKFERECPLVFQAPGR